MPFPEGVRIGEYPTCPLGESGWSLIRIAMHATCVSWGSPDRVDPDVKRISFWGVRMEFDPDSTACHVSSGGGVPTGLLFQLS